MCNLYRMTTGAQAIAQMFRAETGGRNLPALEEIYPDQAAPGVVAAGHRPSMELLRRGRPPFGAVMLPLTTLRHLPPPLSRSPLDAPSLVCYVSPTLLPRSVRHALATAPRGGGSGVDRVPRDERD